MLRKFKKTYLFLILIFFGLFFGLNAFAQVQFVNEVILDLPGLDPLDPIYIYGNPDAPLTINSFNISGAELEVFGLNDDSAFFLRPQSYNPPRILILNVGAGGTADFTISSSNISDNYINQWTVTTGDLVNYVIGVPLANTDYTVRIERVSDNTLLNEFVVNSGADALINFSRIGSGIRERFIIYIPCQNHDIWGYAWSDRIGSISFSCKNCDANDDGFIDPGVCGGGGVGITGLSQDYGVDIDGPTEGNTGNFSGYTWAGGGINPDGSFSPTIGWISFNALEFGACPVGFGPCQPNVSLTTGAVTGYARACTVFQSGCSGALKPDSELGGWEGWIRLSGTWPPNGVTLNSGVGPPSEFQGWAWGGDDIDGYEAIIGWISFNGDNVAGGADYAVYTNLSINNAPTAAISPTTTGNYCFAASPPIFLNWTFNDVDGDTQSAYQIQIDNSGAAFPSPEIDTGKVLNSGNTYVPIGLSFGTTYWWRIRVWDSRDLQSLTWVIGSFATDPRWPSPSFTWSPASPLAEEDVQFDSTVSYCAACTYLWDFVTGSSIIADPIYAFPAEDVYNVTLRATSGGLWCEISQLVSVGAALPLPTWNEIAPF